MGWHGVSTKRITCWAPNQFCRFNQIRGSPVLNCWPVACDDYLAMVSHVSKIGRQTSLVRTHMHYPGPFHVSIPSNASSFTMFHPWIFPPSPTRAAKRLFPSGSQFLSCSPVSRDPRAFRLGSTADMRNALGSRETGEQDRNAISLQLIAVRTAEFDVWKQCAESAVSFFSLAHTDVKDMDEL